jgi:hypothetical protein
MAAKSHRGESEVFDIARTLIQTTKKLLPNADKGELKRTIEAAVNEMIDEQEAC